MRGGKVEEVRRIRGGVVVGVMGNEGWESMENEEAGLEEIRGNHGTES